MARNSSIYARRAGLTLLSNDAPLVAFVADRIYPPQRPAAPQWPFVGWGVPIVAPFGASCMDGSTIDLAVHVYAETSGEGGATISGEERATAIAARVETALDGATVDLAAHGCPYPATAHFTWTGTQVIQDGAEADAFHGIVSLRLSIAS